MQRTLRDGQFLIHGYAQEMQDGRWAAMCTVTEHRAAEAIDHVVDCEGIYRAAKEDAEAAGLEIGVRWLNKKFPI